MWWFCSGNSWCVNKYLRARPACTINFPLVQLQVLGFQVVWTRKTCPSKAEASATLPTAWAQSHIASK
jgi:hypothetical protein